MTDRRGTHDRQVTFPDAVKIGARSDTAKITVTGSYCTVDNRSKFILREDKVILSCTESVWFIVRKGRVTELYRDCEVYCEEGKSY
jgi:hypothetical protein